MIACVNKSHPKFKELSNVYGSKLANQLVIVYSRGVKNLTEDIYYPTLTEVKNWLTNDKKEIVNNISRAFKIDPLLSERAIKSFLKGVIHDYKGSTYISAGPFNEALIKQEVRDTVFLPNLKIMRELETMFPRIFRIRYTNKEHVRKVDITPLKEGEQGRLFNSLPGSTVSSEAPAGTVAKIKEFIKRIGVDIKTLEKVNVKGNTYNEKGVALIMQKLIRVAEGADATVLTEEAMHFAVEIIKQKDPKLYRKLLKEINNYKILQMVYKDYSSNPSYQTPDGKPDILKLKEEAIAKVLAETIISQDSNVVEKPELVEKVNSWWREIIEFLKGLFSTSGFDKVAMDILTGKFEGTANDIKAEEDRLFYNLGTQEGLYNELVSISNSIKLKDDKYYINDKRIRLRVSDLTRTWLDKIFADKALTKSEFQKGIDDLKAEMGTAGHKAFEYAFHKLVDENGYLRDITIEELDESDFSTQNPGFGWEMYVILRNNLKERLESLDNNRSEGRTRFLSEITIYDKKRDLAGTIDLLAIKPDSSVSIYDWKFMDLNIDKYDDIPWYKVNAWNKQMTQYKLILQYAYNIKPEKFGQTRMIPILARYTEANAKKKIKPSLKEVIIGDVNVKKIENDYLLPVGLENEKTEYGKKIDDFLGKLNDIYKTMSEKKINPSEKAQKAEQLNSLMKAIRQLQIKGNVVPLVNQAELLNKEARRIIEKYKNTFEGKNPKSFSEKERNDFSKELIDIREAVSNYSNLDTDLSQIFGEDVTTEADPLFKAVASAADNARRMSSKLGETLNTFVSEHIAASEGVNRILSPEKVIKGISKLFVSTSGLQMKSIEVLFKKANRALAHAAFETLSENKKLERLKTAYDNWAKAKGLTQKGYFDIIKKKDSNELIDEFSPDFYDELKTKIAEKDYTWIAENVDKDSYKEHLQKKLEEEIERIKNKPRLLSEEDNKKQIDKEIQQAKTLYDISKKDSVGWLLYKQVSKFPSRDKWESKEWKDLNKPENKPAKDFYDYIIQKNKEYSEIGYINNPREFLPYVRKNLVEKAATGGNIKLFDQFFTDISVDEGDIGYGQIDPLTGRPRNVVPKYFTSKLDKEVSTDLFRTISMYNEAATRYKYITNIENQISAILEVERNKKAIATSMFGKTQYKDGEIQYTNDNTSNSKLLEDMTKSIIYGQKFIQSETFDQLLFKLGKWGETFNKKLGMDIFPEDLSERQVSVNKVLNQLNNTFQLTALGLNPLSASSNFFGGTFQSLINSGRYFTKTDYIASEGMIFMNKFNKTDQKKMIGALEYFLPLTDNYNRMIARKLSLNTLTQESIQDFLMILMRNTDWNIQTANFYAFLRNTAVINNEVVNVREYIRALPEYQNKYKGTAESLKKYEENFENKVKELMDQYGILKVAKIENGEFVIPGVDRYSDSVVELRRKVQQTSKDALGNLTEDDIRMINSNVYGKSFMVFKNWIPRPMDVRIGNLKYNAASDAYEWGRLRTIARIVGEDLYKSLGNLYGCLTGNDRGIKFMRELYEKKKADYELDTDKPLEMTEDMFVDLVRLNVKNSMTDAIFLATMFILVAGLKAAIPDEDEDPALINQYKFIVKMADKFKSELAYFYDPTSLTGFVSTGIFPAVNLVNTFKTAVQNFMKETWGIVINDQETVDDTKVIKYVMRSFPVTNQMSNYMPMFYPELAKDLGIKMSSDYNIRR